MKRMTIIAAAFSLLFAAHAAAQTATILPGVLDLAVAPGSRIPDQCPAAASDQPNAPAMGCVVFARAEAFNMQRAYLTQLIAAGWRNAGTGSNAVRLERPITADCSGRLTMAGMPHGTAAEIQAWADGQRRMDQFDTLSIWFSLEREPVCGEARALRG